MRVWGSVTCVVERFIVERSTKRRKGIDIMSNEDDLKRMKENRIILNYKVIKRKGDCIGQIIRRINNCA